MVRQVRKQALRRRDIDPDRLARRVAGDEQAYEFDAVAEAGQVVIEELQRVGRGRHRHALGRRHRAKP